ncbi:MAG: glycoside hydrolase family 3 N-terminal domain-containing protein [Longicatena sp.]
MKKQLCLLMALVLMLSVGGCSKGKKADSEPNTNTKTEETKEKEYVVEGIIKEATSTNIIVLVNNEEMEFNHADMKLTGDIKINNKIKITYVVKNGMNVARSGVVSASENTPVATTNHKIDTMIADMSLEEKVGQMFYVRCPSEAQVSDVANYHIGGYILFDRDFNGKSFQQVVNNIASYQNNAKIPLLIGVDEEGGSVNRVSNYRAFRGVPFWSPQALYASGGYDLVLSDTKEKAALLKSIGINSNLAPVADVSTNPNDFINARSFGRDANQTSEFISKVVGEMKKDGMGSTLKHFPGYGNNVDTHTGISIDERSYKNFQQNDFLPFKAGIDAGADSILVSHNIINCIDANAPASLSAKVHEVLRKELGFTRVIMSDDLAMDAIKKYTDASVAAISAIKAGNDLLICSDYRNQLPAVMKAVQNKEIDEKQIEASVRRILEWKKSLGLFK